MTKVLVVDDERQIRRALSLNLGARAYEVVEASTGQAALEVASAEHPDVVLLDLGLPDMDGMKVLAALRERDSLAVIVVTVRDDERSKMEAMQAGAEDYVTKPFDMADLIERVRVVLSRRAGPPQG